MSSAVAEREARLAEAEALRQAQAQRETEGYEYMTMSPLGAHDPFGLSASDPAQSEVQEITAEQHRVDRSALAQRDFELRAAKNL